MRTVKYYNFMTKIKKSWKLSVPDAKLTEETVPVSGEENTPSGGEGAPQGQDAPSSGETQSPGGSGSGGDSGNSGASSQTGGGQDTPPDEP